MRKAKLIILLISIFVINALDAEEYIVYTAHQTWLSRIYIINMDGSVNRYYEYDMYRFCDLEVVNGDVYVAEAFAPRVYKLDISNGDLDLIIDDWSLFYFYGLVFDGNYFYVAEWDLNRYDINGNKDGTAGFDDDMWGGAWDGSYLWTLSDTVEIKCWDISNWPTLNEIDSNNFSPPTPACKGLWYDGEYFWTAECIDNTLGYIYQFDSSGTIINQWLEPAFSGWSACVVSVTGIDEKPSNDKISDKFYLKKPYPNPFTSHTELTFSIPENSKVSIKVYSITGEYIKTLFMGFKQAGISVIEWNRRDFNGNLVKSGIYIIYLKACGDVKSQKIIVVGGG